MATAFVDDRRPNVESALKVGMLAHHSPQSAARATACRYNEPPPVLIQHGELGHGVGRAVTRPWSLPAAHPGVAAAELASRR